MSMHDSSPDRPNYSKLKADERRKYSRIGTDQVISFAPLDNRDLLGVSRNVSSGGIRFEAVGCEINLGDTLRVTFNVGEHTVIAVGQVAWATEMDPITTDVGLEFFEIDPTTGAELSVVEMIGTQFTGLAADPIMGVLYVTDTVNDQEHGLRALYVALTRPTQRLSIVHADELPQ